MGDLTVTVLQQEGKQKLVQLHQPLYYSAPRVSNSRKGAASCQAGPGVCIRWCIYAWVACGARCINCDQSKRIWHKMFHEKSFGRPGPVYAIGCVACLQADVVNRGMSGWNTRWAAGVLPTTLAELMPQQGSSNSSDSSKPDLWNPKVQLLVIWFGANDAVAPTGKE